MDGTFCWDSRKDNRTRGGDKLEVEFPHNESFKKTIAYQGPLFWNELLYHGKENMLPEVFKKNLKNNCLRKNAMYEPRYKRL